MLCKNCGCDTYTVETRERKDAYVRRRKVCEMCGEKFTTFEFTDDVVKEVIELLEGRKHVIMNVRKKLPQFYSNEVKTGRKFAWYDKENKSKKNIG